MKEKKTFSWPQTLLTVALSVLIASGVWLGFYGVPLLGLPKAEDVQSVTLVSLDSDSITVTDAENVELLVKAANLLNYKLGTPDTTRPGADRDLHPEERREPGAFGQCHHHVVEGKSPSAQAAGGVLQHCGRSVSDRTRQRCKRIKDHAERTTLFQ